ncbi:MAG: hypothetical protein RJB66_733 [Pseudomonadota bacterium]|jgi:hypothetical protein
MKKLSFLVFSIVSLELTTGVGCARSGYSPSTFEKQRERISNSAEVPPIETIEEDPHSVRFGNIEIGGLNCNITAGESAIIERDSIQIPAFDTFVELKEGQSLKRSSCNLSVPFYAQANTGFAITGVEFEHEYTINDSAVFRLNGEVFVAGTIGSKFEEMVLITKEQNEKTTEHKLFELREPLIVCGKNSGLLRMNLGQILEAAEPSSSGLSQLRALKITYTPVDCQ